uniref:exo-alpha-sialidase n=1 Tax=Latimeria chalumnae TaxID=7897 RepID=H2ZZL0_LATCH
MFSFLKEWATFALGPGHGIQLKSGRLIIPAYTYHIDCRECFGKMCKTTPHSFTFYSDSHGKNWRFGEFIPNLETVECQMVSVDEEMGTNILYCNARSPLGFRVQAISSDDGAVFLSGELVQKLVEPPYGCHGSVIGFPAPFISNTHLSYLNYLYSSEQQQTFVPFSRLCTYNQGERPLDLDPVCKSSLDLQAPTWVLYSHPISPTSRVNLGVYLSTFPRDPDSWTEPWVIYEGPSGYSDLACIEISSSVDQGEGIPAMVFACLYENGTKTPYEEISFSFFTLFELL